MADRRVLLETSGLEIQFETRRGTARAVNDLNLTLYEGERFGLVGESGSGKTTLMRALADAAVSNGHETLAIDADPQKALFRWHQDLGRETPGLTVKELDDPNALEAMLDEAEKTAAYVFIDTLGAGGMWADILVEQSNFLICPMMPSLRSPNSVKLIGAPMGQRTRPLSLPSRKALRAAPMM